MLLIHHHETEETVVATSDTRAAHAPSSPSSPNRSGGVLEITHTTAGREDGWTNRRSWALTDRWSLSHHSTHSSVLIEARSPKILIWGRRTAAQRLPQASSPNAVPHYRLWRPRENLSHTRALLASGQPLPERHSQPEHRIPSPPVVDTCYSEFPQLKFSHSHAGYQWPRRCTPVAHGWRRSLFFLRGHVRAPRTSLRASLLVNGESTGRHLRATCSLSSSLGGPRPTKQGIRCRDVGFFLLQAGIYRFF